MTNKDFNKYYVLDTNVILNDATSIIKFSEESKNLIILPETVLDELDAKKTGFDEINFQAREFARILSDSKVVDKKDFLKNQKVKNSIIRIHINSKLNITIDIVSKEKYKSIKNKNFADNLINDRKILEITKDCQEIYNKKIEFISSDIMARTRAISFDIPTSDVLGDKKNILEYVFHKVIEIDEELDLKNFNGKDIKKIDPDYKPNLYTYEIKVKSGQSCFGYILNDKFIEIKENAYKDMLVRPLSLEQRFFCSGILEPNFNILVVDAKAGSGKTLLALSSAIKLIDLKKYSKIIYIRNSIESIDKGEDVGYLPGLAEKFKIYNHPLYDSLDFMIREKYKDKKTMTEEALLEEMDNLKEKYHIDTMWVGEMRGRTITNSVVIIDECLANDQILYTKEGKKTIEEIEKSFIEGKKVEVLSKNLQNNIAEYKEMLSLKVEDIDNTKEDMYEIELEDGQKIKVTGNHKLFINGKYQKVIDVLNSNEDLYLDKYDNK